MTEEAPPPQAPRRTRLLRWIAAALVLLVALAGLALVGLNTAPGRRFLAAELGGYSTESGISIHAGRIEGSIYGRMTITGLTVNDTRGPFLAIPRLELDWRPFAYLRKRIDVRSATAADAVLLRSPELKPVPPKPDQPLLPDLDIALGRLQVDRFTIEPAVDGKRHVIAILGSAAIASGRARIDATARAIAAPGVAGGDDFRLKLDAVPAENRLLVDLRLDAPTGGIVDSYAHLGHGFTLALGGRGDWANWRGTLNARAGNAPLAAIALSGTNGRFRMTGNSYPAAVLAPGAGARLTAPALAIDGEAVLGERRADLRLDLRSAALAVKAAGLVDLARNRLGDFRIATRVLTPGAIAPAARARDLVLDLRLDGPFATPTIDYDLRAAMLAFNETAIEGLRAGGHATVDASRVTIPITATARRVTGLNAAAGGLLQNLSANGSFALSGGKLATDNLRIRSDRLDATVLAVADLPRGTYVGAVKGRVNDYRIDGLGRVALEADAHLVPGRNGGFGIAGWVRARTRQIDNASVRRFLGGDAQLATAFAYSPDGVASAHGLRVTAPGLRLSGEGSYRPDGRIAFHASGNSAQYGPLALNASGTVAKPLLRLHADRPNPGIQLANVDATVTGNGSGGYDIRATGGSPYGPFSGDIGLRTGAGPLRIEVRRALFAGVRFAGTLGQTAAGPFSGSLGMNGSGLSGRLQLAAAGAIQRVDATLAANAARIPGTTPITIGSGRINAGLLLYPGAPAATVDAVVRDLRQGALVITNGQARVRYRDGRGNVAVTASGHGGVPFKLAAQAALAPDRVVANLTGTANAIAFRLAAPATIARQGGDWLLAPATVVLPQGRLVLFGRYGARPQLHAQLVNVDLSLAQAALPGFGLGGKASGTVDLAMAGGNAIPISRTRLDISRFTRTGALAVSDPIDLSLLATTGATGADIGALVQRRGATVGRAKVHIGPGAGESWTARLMHGSLAGGIRYAGPAELLWTLGGFAGQELSGPIVIAADLGGGVERPTLTGLMRASQLRYENSEYGTVIRDIALDGRFTQSQLQLTRFAGKAGDGTVSARGSVSLDASAGYPIDLAIELANARLARSDALGATASGQIAITNTKAAGGLIKGDIRLGEARYRIIRQGSGEVPELTGVHRKGQSLQARAESGPAPSRWKLDLSVRAPGRLFVSGMGLEAEWATDMRIGGTAGAPSVVGELDVVRGTYSFAGKNLTLDDSSRVTFDGSALLDPLLAITASTTVNAISATIAITGRAQRPQIAFTSTPALPQDEVLSRLLFGSSVTTLSPTEAIQLAAALNSLRGSGGGFNPLGKLRSVAGFDRLRILGGNPATGQGTSVAAGKYIARNVYVEVITDARGFTATQLEVALSKALSILSSTGSFGGSNATLRYRRDR